MSNDRPENLSADDAITRLQAGNGRYVAGESALPQSQAGRRAELVDGQRPFVTILACADSRVSPEHVFDEGLGDLFVIRVAGNIATPAVLGSIEYASLHLGVNLIVVVGHRSCGAVTAAVDNVDFDGPATHSHIDALIDAIKPAAKAARDEGDHDLLDRAIRANASMVAGQISGSEPVMAGLAAQGVRVVPGYYDLESGVVSLG
jgi:carbonic anhydrase